MRSQQQITRSQRNCGLLLFALPCFRSLSPVFIFAWCTGDSGALLLPGVLFCAAIGRLTMTATIGTSPISGGPGETGAGKLVTGPNPPLTSPESVAAIRQNPFIAEGLIQ